jgi:hypothetical protein
MRRFYRGLIRKADAKATSLGFEYVGAEHLLIALATEADNWVAQVLLTAGVQPEILEIVLRHWFPADMEPLLESPLALAPRKPSSVPSARLARSQSSLLPAGRAGAQQSLRGARATD